MSFDAPGLIASSMERLRRGRHGVDRSRSATRRSPRSLADIRLVVPHDAIAAGQTDAEVMDRFDEWLGMLYGGRRHDRRGALPMFTEASIAARRDR